MQYIYSYLISVFVFFLADMVWLGKIAKNMYADKLGYLLGPVNWVAAVIFYLLFLVGLNYFAITPAIKNNSFNLALLNGAFFGFITYATYDLTNLATVKDWPLSITLIDMAWGTALGALTSVITYKLVQIWFLKA